MEQAETTASTPCNDSISIPFDIHKHLNATPAKDIVSEVFGMIAQDISKTLNRDRKLYRQNVETVLVNLFVAWDTHWATEVAYSAGHDAYDAGSRYNKLHISRVVPKIVESMRKHGLVDVRKGFHDRTTGRGRVSRMRATDALAEMFYTAAMSRDLVERSIEEIVLREAPSRSSSGKRIPGKPIEYEDTRKTNGMRRVMRRINAMLKAGTIRLDLSSQDRDALRERMGYEIDTTRAELRRIFNESFDFDRGGRLYSGWWQGIPSELRARIRINGNATAELDFKELHPRLAYAEIGVMPPAGDLYSIPLMAGQTDAVTWRKKAKLVLNCMLNAKDKQEAVLAVQKQCNEKGIKTSHAQIRWIMTALEQKHTHINSLFYTGAGSLFQFIDSEMAIEIMLDLQEQGVLALPVHDSFVVEVQHVEKLHAAMTRAYRKQCGYDPLIDRKP